MPNLCKLRIILVLDLPDLNAIFKCGFFYVKRTDDLKSLVHFNDVLVGLALTWLLRFHPVVLKGVVQATG